MSNTTQRAVPPSPEELLQQLPLFTRDLQLFCNGASAQSFVSERVAYKQEFLAARIATRDCVQEFIDMYLRQHFPRLCALEVRGSNSKIRVVPSGSYANFVQSRRNHFDFDLLWVFDCIGVDVFQREVTTRYTHPRFDTRVYLNALAQAADAYRSQKVTIDSPSVTFNNNGVSFDLLPALQVRDEGDGVFLVPFGEESDPHTWRLSFTRQQKDIIKDLMEQHHPGIRDAIKVVKFWNGLYSMCIPSFAVVCAAYWMCIADHPCAHRCRFLWSVAEPRLQCVSWVKVAFVLICLYHLIESGFVPHMFSDSPGGNVLPEGEEAGVLRQNLRQFISRVVGP